MAGMTHNGTPPYTFRYYRYMARHDDECDDLAEAVRMWSGGEDYGELSGDCILDSTGEVVVTKEQWRRALWRACDDARVLDVLSDPMWREKVSAEREREEREMRRRAEEHKEYLNHLNEKWLGWMKELTIETGVSAILSWERPQPPMRSIYFDSIDPFGYEGGVARPYLKIGKAKFPLFEETTREEMREFMLGNRPFGHP